MGFIYLLYRGAKRGSKQDAIAQRWSIWGAPTPNLAERAVRRSCQLKMRSVHHSNLVSTKVSIKRSTESHAFKSGLRVERLIAVPLLARKRTTISIVVPSSASGLAAIARRP